MALVVLLRGVNVGGHRTFRPTVLVEQLKHLEAVNIGAAGTLVIRRRIAATRLRAELARRLPFDAEIMICRGSDIIALASGSHFAGCPDGPDIVRFVSVLSRSPRSGQAVPFALPSGGPWMLKVLARENRYVLGVYRRQMQAIRYLDALDKLFGAPATTRNWNTITAIAEVLEGRGKNTGKIVARRP